MRTVVRYAIVPALFMLLGHGLTVYSQTQATPPGKFVSAEAWTKQLDAAGTPVEGAGVTIVPNLMVRRRQDTPNNASVHSAEVDKLDITEIYLVIDGSGTVMTGGTMPDPKNRTAGIKGGVTHELKKGDFLIIPAGTAHWFPKINGQLTYLQVRFPTAR